MTKAFIFSLLRCCSPFSLSSSFRFLILQLLRLLPRVSAVVSITLLQAPWMLISVSFLLSPSYCCFLPPPFFPFSPQCSSSRVLSLFFSPFYWLGLRLTLPSFLFARGPSPGEAGFSQKNRPSSRVALGANSSSSDGLLSSSSSGEIFPFEIWYRDNAEDDVSEDPFSWVDGEGSLLLGLMKKLLRPGPWRVRLRHCQPTESVNNRTSSEEAPFFYAYEPVFSKLGLKLPFTTFEQSVLRALNVAPSQLHPNSWAFVRTFELLCEDLGQAPSLGVFFWFFRVKKTAKVGWMSLSSRPNRKLLKPFLERFKIFKDKFFKICPGKSRPSFMFDPSGAPLFPFYWTSQPTVSITVVRKDLEEWEDKFISKLETLPRFFCSELIRGSVKLLKDLKKNMPSTEGEGASATVDIPQAAVPLQEVLGDLSPHSARSEAVAAWSAGEQVAEEEVRRPGKHPRSDDADSEGELGRPSHSVWSRSKFITEVVDQNVLTLAEGSLVSRLGISRTLDTIQRLAGCTAILARAAEVEFGPMADRLAHADEERKVWSQTRAEYENQLGLYKEDLQRTSDQYAHDRAEWAAKQDALAAEADGAKAKISSLESEMPILWSKVASQEEELKVKDATLAHRNVAMVKQYEYGFRHAFA
ncbi:hypothetical protein CR513_33109, partial [Mucuna pruriens]